MISAPMAVQARSGGRLTQDQNAQFAAAMNAATSNAETTVPGDARRRRPPGAGGAAPSVANACC